MFGTASKLASITYIAYIDKSIRNYIKNGRNKINCKGAKRVHSANYKHPYHPTWFQHPYIITTYQK